MSLLSQLVKLIPDPSPPPRLSKQSKDLPQELVPTRTEIDTDARPANELSIHLGEHWAVVGSTGSGKTYFTVKGLLEYMRIMFPDVPRYVLDSTDDPDMFNLVYNPLGVSGNKPPDLLKDARHTLVWTPTNSKIPSAYADWFNKLNDSRKPAIVLLNEAASITGNAVEAMETLFKQMRKHGGTVIAETQTIGKIDTSIFSQVSHYVQFFINPEQYDLTQARKYLLIPKEEQRPPLYEHGFFHRRTRGRVPVKEYRDMKEFFGDTI